MAKKSTQKSYKGKALLATAIALGLMLVYLGDAFAAVVLVTLVGIWYFTVGKARGL